MELNHKVRLYPNATMKQVLDNHCDYRRYCWNQGLDLWNLMSQERRENLPVELRNRIRQHFIEKDKSVEFADEELTLMAQYVAPSNFNVRNRMVASKEEWMHRYSSRVLQLAIKDLAKAWKDFWNKTQSKQGRPKFKSKKADKQGFKTDRARIKDGKNGKYYAVITIKVESKAKALTGQHTGVDTNVKRFDYTDGQFDVFPQRLQKLYDQIRGYQRLIARKENERKKSGRPMSRRERVMRTKLRTCYKTMTNFQHDLVHKFTNQLTSLYDVIAIEDLNVKGMQLSKRCKNLHRSLFGFFKEVITYKCKRDGKRLVLADRFYPSTQRCSSCGHIKTGDDKITLSGNQKHGTKHYEYICYKCGFSADRDKNAVLNLLALTY